MTELINTMFSGVTITAEGLGNAIKDMFLNIIYDDPAAEVKVISQFATFIFLMFGVSLTLGLGYFIINKVSLKI